MALGQKTPPGIESASPTTAAAQGQRTPGGENRQIARAAGLVGGLTFLSRIGGLMRDVVIGYLFGTGAAADAFFVAFRVPNLLRRFVAEGAMGVAFIPVFSEYLAQRSHAEAVAAARAAATVLALFVAALTLAGIAFAPLWTRLFAPGFIAEPGKFALTVGLTRLVFPYIFCVSLVALMGGILNAMRHFTAPALAPLCFNLCVIAAAIVLVRLVEPPAYALAYGVLLGGVVQVALQVPPLAARGFSLRPLWNPAHEMIRRILRLMAPMVFGAAVYQINVMLSTILASVLPGGAVSYLWYAGRIFEFPLGIAAVALGTAALPSFSAQAARGEYGELSHSLAFALRLTSFIAVPAAAAIAILATPICAVLFQRGAFGPAEAALTARALVAFATGLWSVSLVRIVVPAFYALQDTRTPVITAAAAFAANVLFSLMLMGPVAAGSGSRIEQVIATATHNLAFLDLGHAGLALATSLAATVNLVLLLLALHRALPQLRLAELIPSLTRTIAATAVMTVPLFLLAGAVDWEAASFATRALALSTAVGAGLAVYGLVALALGSTEARLGLRMVAERLRDPGRFKRRG